MKIKARFERAEPTEMLLIPTQELERYLTLYLSALPKVREADEAMKLTALISMAGQTFLLEISK